MFRIKVGTRGKHLPPSPPAMMVNCPTCSHIPCHSPINPVNRLLTL